MNKLFSIAGKVPLVTGGSRAGAYLTGTIILVDGGITSKA